MRILIIEDSNIKRFRLRLISILDLTNVYSILFFCKTTISRTILVILFLQD